MFIILFLLLTANIAQSYPVYPGDYQEVMCVYSSERGPTNVATSSPPGYIVDYAAGTLVSSALQSAAYKIYYLTNYSLVYCEDDQWATKTTIQVYVDDACTIKTPEQLNAAGTPCPNQCTDKTGDKWYDLVTWTGGGTYTPESPSCYDGCQQTAVVLWQDCTFEPCVASVEYTTTGQLCDSEPTISGLVQTPPSNCSTEIAAKAVECGGTLNIQTWDYETCTGTCTPLPCEDEWAAKVTECGGVMMISTWNNQTCTGTCVSEDPVSDPIPETVLNTPPTDINSNFNLNEDGTYDKTTETTYQDMDGGTYTQTTITHFASDGTETGSSTSTSYDNGDGTEDGTVDGTGPGPSAPTLVPGEASTRTMGDLDWTGVQSAFSAVGDKMPFQGMADEFAVFGESTSTAPVWTWPGADVTVAGISFDVDPITLDFSSMEPIAIVLRWGLAIITLVLAGRWLFKVYGGN